MPSFLVALQRLERHTEYKGNGKGKHCRVLEDSGVQWSSEIDYHAPSVPVILVGTKLDLRDDPATLESLRKKRIEPEYSHRATQSSSDWIFTCTSELTNGGGGTGKFPEINYLVSLRSIFVCTMLETRLERTRLRL
ncbi:hypothetical protein V8E51_008840 [Hyaloscypha variabilis]